MNLQEYKRIDISKDEILPLAERMKKEGRYLVMIHGLINKDGQPDVSWDYAVDPAVGKILVTDFDMNSFP